MPIRNSTLEAPRKTPARRRSARRRLLAAARNLRELGSIASALASTSHPYMAHIVPMRPRPSTRCSAGSRT
jgi:hypothetical protein